jgi:predicted transport protein
VPIFDIVGEQLSAVRQENFALEKDLQKLIEDNLGTVFGCRFVATEFSTGAQHAGRIDSLALSEDDNPVVIEYKKVESSDLINQSLFYLSWLYDHKGDFELAAQNTLGSDVKVDWSGVRVICIAPNFKKYDLHAVQMMGAPLELWKYRLFSNNSLYLEEVFQASRSSIPSLPDSNGSKNPVMVEAGKKAALTRATGVYTFEERLGGKGEEIIEMAYAIRDFVLGLDPSIEEVPKKLYVAYKASQNIVCVEVKGKTIKLFLKLKSDDVPAGTVNYRDMTSIGHFGTGDAEFTIQTLQDFEGVKPFITQAYNKVGG